MARSSGSGRGLAVVVAVIGVVMVIAGAATWYMVTDQLSAENITVSEDADFLAGDEVDGPFSAYAQAEVINKHALEATGGKTYAELDQDDPVREVAMSASFLRASLFTSVVAYGVAAMAMGLGVTLFLVALALMSVARTASRAEVDRV
ncbi:aromatic ring-opening dioxygenase LigA [Nocardioides sp.]|uniref:aromatic ring-opening dioxygenase LigA n=1 Tax=Nocardioides sp. TaxID=35761 RepID=UPI002ED4E3C2